MKLDQNVALELWCLLKGYTNEKRKHTHHPVTPMLVKGHDNPPNHVNTPRMPGANCPLPTFTQWDRSGSSSTNATHQTNKQPHTFKPLQHGTPSAQKTRQKKHPRKKAPHTARQPLPLAAFSELLFTRKQRHEMPRCDVTTTPTSEAVVRRG